MTGTAGADQLSRAGRMLDAGKDDEALAAISGGGNPIAAWMTLGNFLLRKLDLVPAERAARAAIACRTDDPDAALLLARVLFQTERLDEALDAARHARSLAPDNPDTCMQVVLTLLDLGQPEQALTEASFLRTQPQSDVLKGLVLRRIGRLDEALVVLETVAKRHPGQIQAQLWLAHTFHDLGRTDEAIAVYSQLIKQLPTLEDARYGLVNSLAAQGRLAEAARAYSVAAQAVQGFTKRWPEFLVPTDGLDQKVAVQDTEEDGLSMVLAFVPFDFPSIPLGIATLKAFVERHSPHRITTVDLNARFFKSVVKTVAQKATPFELPDGPAFVEAVDFLSTMGPQFLDPDHYTPSAMRTLEHVATLKAVFTNQCLRVQRQDGPIPWHCLAMAKGLTAGGPAIVGLSAMFDSQLPVLHALARAIKTVAPDVKVVWGGCVLARQGVEALLSTPYVDYVVLLDGEQTLVDLLNALALGDVEPEIPGLCHRRADGTFCIRDDTVPLKQDRVPPADFRDFDLGAYFNPEPVLPLLTSRGCYWRRCTFCNHFAGYAGTYKARSVDRVVEEIEEQMARHGVRHFTLVDEMISAARFRKISEQIIARGLEISYYALAKPTADFTPEILELMSRSGCRYILWGQESGNDRILAVMDKGTTVQSSSATLKAAAQAGIRNHLFLMVGYPGEGLDELADTIRFLHDNHAAIDQTQSGTFMLEKGTPLYRHPSQFNIGKIRDRRAYGGCLLVPFETTSGLQPPQAVVAEKTMRRALFRQFNPFSYLLGDFRDHALIVYSSLPRPEHRQPPPPPEEVIGRIRAELGAG